MDVEPVDKLGAALLGLAAYPMPDWWLQAPNASFGGRRPMDACAERPDVVADIARLAVRHDFRARPR